MCGESGTVLLALHNSANHLRFLLLEDLRSTASQLEGQQYWSIGQRQFERAEYRWTINLCSRRCCCCCCCSCCRQSFKAAEQVAEKRHQDDDSCDVVLHRVLAASPVHARRWRVWTAPGVESYSLQRPVGGRFRQLLREPVHLCHRPVPVPESTGRRFALPTVA